MRATVAQAAGVDNMGVNYLSHVIKLNGTRVLAMTVVGLAVEVFLSLALHARKGFNVLVRSACPRIIVTET